MRSFFQDRLTSLWALIRPVVGSVRANAGLAVFSLVLAFVLWIFVSDTEGGSTRSGTLPVAITIQPANVPRGLTLAQELPQVRPKVEVDDDVWDELRADDFEAFVVLTNLSEGTHTVPVQVQAKTSRGKLLIRGAEPSEVEVTLVPLFSKSVATAVESRGTLPRGFAAGKAQTDTATVTVLGAEVLVNLVSKAVATVDLTGVSEEIRRAFPLEARDEQGMLVRGVTLNPTSVNVIVPIEQQETSRAIPISVNIVGSPADGYNVVGVQVTPPVVTVIASKELLNVLSIIRTQPIDINGAKESLVKVVSLDLPAGTSISGSGQVSVRVDLEAAIGQHVIAVVPRIVGLGANLQIVGTLPVVQVTLRGPLPLLRGLGPETVIVQLDLSGLSEGTHLVEVRVQPPTQTQLVAVTPAEVPIILQPRQ